MANLSMDLLIAINDNGLELIGSNSSFAGDSVRPEAKVQASLEVIKALTQSVRQ